MADNGRQWPTMADKLSTRADYGHFLPIQTHWNDMDRYGHVNNMVYYGYMDTVVTEFIMTHGGLDTAASPVVGW